MPQRFLRLSEREKAPFFLSARLVRITSWPPDPCPRSSPKIQPSTCSTAVFRVVRFSSPEAVRIEPFVHLQPPAIRGRLSRKQQNRFPLKVAPNFLVDAAPAHG